jgi:hypothetical protein
MSDMLQAERVRRLGGLPFCIAFQHCDIGEAITDSGERFYITWGRDLDSEDSEWYERKTMFRPIWVGVVELVLCPVDSDLGDWIVKGLRLTDGPAWERVVKEKV